MNLDFFYYTRFLITIIATLILIKYFIYLGLAPFYPVQMKLNRLRLLKKIKKGEISSDYKPLVSIIIPAWNEEVVIVPTIKSAFSNTYRNIEIIVINDGSTDNTEGCVKGYISSLDSEDKARIRYFYKENGGKGKALNYGVTKANGEIILTMDADSQHNKDTVNNLVKYFHDPKVSAVVGNVKVVNKKTLVGYIQNFEYTFGFYFKRVHSLFNAEYIFGGACSAFRKSLTFDKYGLYDVENKTEDIEYSMRLKVFGAKSLYAEDVITYTEGASDLKGLYKQRLRWKKGRIDTFLKYRILFFSTDKSHSMFLSWFVLPYALLGELQTLLEPLFFTTVWAYTFISGDYLSAGISTLFILFTYFAAFIFGDKHTNKLDILMFPATWFMFYILTAVEYLALLKSIELTKNKKDVVWQNWDRKGIKVS